MKLRLMTCAMVASAALFAANETDSMTYGILAVSDTATTNTVVGVPWANVGEGNVTLSNLVSTATLANNDIVYLYEGETWYSYRLNGGVWVPMTSVGEGFGTPDAADAKQLGRGTGLIIQRASNEGLIYLCGRLTNDTVTTSIVANKTALIANPKTTTAYITTGTEGDQISIPGNGGAMKIYEKKSDGWYVRGTPTSVGGISIEPAPTKVNDGVPLEAGKGAFYTSKGASTINWN